MDVFYYALALAVLAVLCAVYIWGTWHYGFFKERGVPYVVPIPLLGTETSLWFGRVSLGELSLARYNAFKGSGLYGYFDFRQPKIMIRDPYLIKMVATKDFDYFTDHVSLGREDDNPLFNKSVFALKGAKWKRIRNVLTPAFTSSKMKAMFTLVEECGKQMGEYLEERLQAEGGESLMLDMTDLFTRTSNDVIATSAFGLHCDSLRDPDNEFYRTGKDALNISGLRMLILLGYMLAPALMEVLRIPAFPNRVYDFFQSLVGDTMKTREREGIVRPDMIHLLMQARKGTLKGDDEDPENETWNKGMDLTDQDITAQAFIFFLAGFDTSSTLLCFLTHMLAVHPDVQRRVQQEMDTVLGEDGGRITYEGVVQKLKYLDMVISETLRMWPPVLEIDRVCVKAYTIPASGTTPAVKISRGQVINIPIYALQRDPDYFPDPDRFDPERFSEENKNNLNQSAYLPFGVGPRACIGLRFALMATKITMVSLLTRFDLEVTSKTQIPLVLKKNSFNTTVEGGFWLAIKPRTNNLSL